MRFLYQQKAEPLDLLVNPPSARTLDQWEPHAEVPRRRPPGQAWQRATYTSGHADPSFFLLPVAVQGVGWLVQNAQPQHLYIKRKFHASLYPAAPMPVWLNTRSIQPLSIASTATVGTPSLVPITSTAAKSGTVNTDATGLIVTWVSGDPFSPGWVGSTITINGVSAVVVSVSP